jgi:uncharacterized protein YkwD
MARDGTRPVRWTPRALTTLLALAGLTAAVWLALGLGPGVAPASAACPHARAHPHDVALSKIRKAITCLVNNKREKRDRRLLEPNHRLQSAARHHTREMLARECFRHKCDGAPGPRRRVKRSGYTDGQRSWRYAEIIGFENTPKQMIGRWMHTRFNRRTLLKGDFRDLGVGVDWGAPRAGRKDGKFATYTIVFGWRLPLR